jgi:hypothetical protein
MENVVTENLKLSWIRLKAEYLTFPAFGGFTMAYGILQSEKRRLMKLRDPAHTSTH